jgi:hypothetical protein
MTHENIPKEFYDRVDRAARDIAIKWPLSDWEDIRQDIWVWLLENPNQLAKYLEMENPRSELKKVGQQAASREHATYELFSGQYEYGIDETRELLEMGVITDSEATTLVESTDLSSGMLLLKDSNMNYFNTIVDKYVHFKEIEDRKLVSRAVEKLATHMNQANKSNRYVDHQGPGARTGMSNYETHLSTSRND